MKCDGEQSDMARAVKETPILRCEDAKRFDQEIKRNEVKKVPREDFERAIRIFKSVKSNSN